MADFLLTVFVVVGVFLFTCIFFWILFKSEEYFAAAFLNMKPEILGSDAAEMDAVIYYYATRLFLVCISGMVALHFYYLIEG